MKLSIQIETGNAAFVPNPEIETARILRELAEKIESGFPEFDEYFGHTIRDHNGNKVGTLEMEGGEQ